MTSDGAEPESGRQQATVDGYCAVTVVCGERRLDVALPSMLPWADLEPAVLRLLFADRPPDRAGRWVLAPIGRDALKSTETLCGAGVLPAEVLVLRQSTGPSPALGGVVYDVRDRLEDVVDGRDEFWGRPQSRRLALWASTVGGGGLLIAVLMILPLMKDGGGVAVAALAGTVAVMLALIAVLAERSGETVCAAVCLSIGCGWAAAAGAAGCRDALTSPAGPGGAPQVTTMVAIGAAAALLVAGAAAAAHSAAVAHVAALVTFGGAASAAAVAVAAGAPEVETACLAALSSVLVIGAVPRLALALGGVTTSGGTASGVRAIGGRASGVRGSGGHGSGGRGSGGRGREPDRGPPLDARIARADRVLTGTVVGLSLVAVAGGLPAALSTDGWHRSFAIGLGMTLILRSRMFSQVRHVVAVRVGGLLVIAELGVGVAVGDPALLPPMVLGAIALLSVTAVLTAGPGRSPVTYARVGRSLDLAEVALVVMMVLLAAGLLGWFGWAAAVIDRAR